MNTLEMDYRFEPRDPSRRIKGLIIVVALHAIIGYALVSGMTRKGLDFIEKPDAQG
jgi:protein TonB